MSTDVTAEEALALRRRVDHFLDDEEPDDGGRVAVQLELERPALGVAMRAAGLQVREAEQRPDVVPEGAPAGERRRVPGLAEGLEPEQHLAALPPPRAPQADHHRLIGGGHVAGRQRPAELVVRAALWRTACGCEGGSPWWFHRRPGLTR